MGEYFKDESKKEKPAQEAVLITDFNVLCSTYDMVVNRIQETTGQGYEAILPIRAELSGTGKSPEDTGQIGELKKGIRNSRIYRTDMGITMWNALKNIEDLDRWSERYAQYLEEHMDGLKLIIKSAFSIIDGLNKKIIELNLEIRRMNDRLVAQTDVMPISVTSSEFESDAKKFRTQLIEGIKKYEDAKRANDTNAIKTVQAKIFEICKDDYVKWEIAQKEMASADKRVLKRP